MRLTRLVGLLLPVLLLTVVLLTGCGGSGDGGSPSDRALRTYFDGVATRTVASLRAAVAVAEPGSPAAGYATYLEASAQAWRDSGHADPPAHQSAQRKGRGFAFCQGSGSGRSCFTYTDIAVTGDKVSDFAVNRDPISDRLAVGEGAPVPFEGFEGSADFVASFEPTAGRDLLVAVTITSSERLTLDAVVATYRSPSGTDATAKDRLGPAVLDAGSSATYVFAFPQAKVGGKLTLAASSGALHGTVALDAGPPLGH